MSWIAKIDIGGYKAGEEVPEEKAITWKGMYEESPVAFVGESVKEEPVVEPEKGVIKTALEEKAKPKKKKSWSK